MSYKPGDPWGICPRCGFRYRLSAFREEWTGQRVCGRCWDAKHPQLDVQGVMEPPARLDILPEPPVKEVAPGEITPEQL